MSGDTERPDWSSGFTGRLFSAMEDERTTHGFDCLVTTECDPRTPGGRSMWIGVRDDGIWLREFGEDEYREVTWVALRSFYPHAHLPDLRAVL